MKKLSKFKILLVLGSILLFFSCFDGSEDSIPEIGGPDPLSWDYGVSWMEIEKRVDPEDWITIERGDTLEISFNYTDASKRNLIGMYGYYNSIVNLNIDLDSIGDVKMEENTISFIYPLSLTATRDTINLPIELIQIENDTLLVIRNTLNTPNTEVKYKKVDFGRIPFGSLTQ